MKKQEKTNVMRILDQKAIEYVPMIYDESIVEGIKIAEILNEPIDQVYKTLVTVSSSRINYVFVIPVKETLDLKKAAISVNEKSISMIKQKELLPLTGYIHGGCSPIGMKKAFKTIIDESALKFDKIYVSAGKVGRQILISTNELSSLISANFVDILVK